MLIVPSSPLTQIDPDFVINRNHPLSRGLVAAVLPSSMGMVEHVNGRQPVLDNGAQYRVGPHGRSVYKNGAMGAVPVTFFNSGVVTNYPVTLFSIYWATASTAYSSILGITNVFANVGCTMFHSANGSPDCAFFLPPSSGTSSGLVPYTDGRVNYAAAAADGTTVRFMLNGVLAQTAFSTAWSVADPPLDRIYLLCISASEGITTGGFHAGYVWNRALSNSELMWLYRNPYAMLSRNRMDISAPRFTIPETSVYIQDRSPIRPAAFAPGLAR